MQMREERPAANGATSFPPDPPRKRSLKPKIHMCRLSMVLCMWLVAASSGAVYYVDTSSGSDSAAGSAARPWRSIDRARSAVKPGDVVNLMPADYGVLNFTPADARGDKDRCILYRSDPEHPGARFSHISFTGAAFYIEVRACEVENTGAVDACIKIDKASEVRIVDCTIRGHPNAAGPTYANVVVQAAESVLVEGCEICYSGPSAHAVQLENSANVTVRGCHVHDIVSSGIRAHGGRDYLIENNVIHDQRADWNPAVHGSGISIRSSNTTLRGNVIYNYGNTRPIRFYPDYAGPGGYANMHVENNLVYKTPDFTGTQWWTEFIDLGPDCVFSNNTFVGDVVMTLATRADGAGLSLYNNIVTGRLQVESMDKWPNIHSGNNVLGKLAAKGCGWLCFRSDFAPSGGNRVGATCGVGGFFRSGPAHYPYGEEYPYQLAPRAPAVDFADEQHAPAMDLLGHKRNGPPDAGCFEYAGTP